MTRQTLCGIRATLAVTLFVSGGVLTAADEQSGAQQKRDAPAAGGNGVSENELATLPPAALREKARQLIAEKKVSDALPIYRLLVQRTPDSVTARRELASLLLQTGDVLVRLGDAEGAQTSFREAVRLNPKHVDAHYNLGLLRLQNWKLDDAIDHFTAALNLNPNYVDAVINLGNKICRADKTLIKSIRALRARLEELRQNLWANGASTGASGIFSRATKHLGARDLCLASLRCNSK